MTALIYEVSNGKVVKGGYKSEAIAQGVLNRAIKRGRGKFGFYTYGKDRLADMAVCTHEHFAKEVDYEVTVKNMMSGRDVTMKRSEVGGPCDPSTERYWSM
jgi:hypothetical protein